MNVKKRKVEDMRRNLVVATLLLAACAAQPPAAPVRPAARKTGVQPLGQFTATVQPNGRGLHALIDGFVDASDGVENQNPVDTLEVFSDVAFSVTAHNNATLCAGAQTIGAPIKLKNYTLDELRQVHVEITFAGSGNDACNAYFGTPPLGSPAVGDAGLYFYPDLPPATASLVTAGLALNSSAGQPVQWDFLDPSPGTQFVVRGEIWAERWPAMPIMTDMVQDAPADPTFHWTTDLAVTRTRLDIVNSGGAVLNRYTVDRNGTTATESTYSLAVSIPKDTQVLAKLYPVAYADLGNQFVGSQFEQEYLFNHTPPAAVAPANASSLKSPVTFSWTAASTATSVIAWVCPASLAIATPADCIAAGTPNEVFSLGTGTYSVSVGGLALGPYKWTLVATDYGESRYPMTGTPTALNSFTVVP
jgi:hypothetical protein